jgi:hypothetical protein
MVTRESEDEELWDWMMPPNTRHENKIGGRKQDE